MAASSRNAPTSTRPTSRVRFNSNTAASTLPAITVDTGNISRKPHPILRSAGGGEMNANSTPTRVYLGGLESPSADIAAVAAHRRGSALADDVWRDSPPDSRSSSETMAYSDPSRSEHHLLARTQDVELRSLEPHASQSQNTSSYNNVITKDFVAVRASDSSLETPHPDDKKDSRESLEEIYNASYDGSYKVPPPDRYRGGILSQLMKLGQPGGSPRGFGPRSPATSSHRPTPSDTTTPTTPERRRWYDQSSSQDTLATLVGASTKLAKPAQPQGDHHMKFPKHKREASIGKRINAILNPDETVVRIHIAGTVARQEFILKVCRALMIYGAPTHRLEEYLTMTARALEIAAQFLYIPGCMIISFDDAATHTTEVKLVRVAQDIDLGRLKDVHRIYKEVIHDVTGVETATEQLDGLMKNKPKFHPWFRVLIFGLTSVTSAPFSFSARLIDLPFCFFLGCLVGALQLIVAPRSPLYSNVFEVSATVLVSFLARAFGSIKGGQIFCFSALVQGGIVMLLPGTKSRTLRTLATFLD
jgi:uncharacterized membrane protein YjjP (DUF1212 family)